MDVPARTFRATPRRRRVSAVAAWLLLAALNGIGAAPSVSPLPGPALLPPLPASLPAGPSNDDWLQIKRDLNVLAEKLATDSFLLGLIPRRLSACLSAVLAQAGLLRLGGE